ARRRTVLLRRPVALAEPGPAGAANGRDGRGSDPAGELLLHHVGAARQRHGARRSVLAHLLLPERRRHRGLERPVACGLVGGGADHGRPGVVVLRAPGYSCRRRGRLALAAAALAPKCLTSSAYCPRSLQE